MNSLPLNKPARGRNSSRYFRPIWYKRIGNCLGDLNSEATRRVISSSWVGASNKSDSFLSLSRKN